VQSLSQRLIIATYRVNLEDPLREIKTDNGNILMHGKLPRPGSTAKSSHTTPVQGPSIASGQQDRATFI
jgi:hypothetical protein